MQAYFLRKEMIMREEAQLWDILSRDLKREAGRQEDTPTKRVRFDMPPPPISEQPKVQENRMFVRIPEAARMMGMGKSSLYKEISAGNLKVRKSGKKTLIALTDIQEWFYNLSEGTS